MAFKRVIIRRVGPLSWLLDAGSSRTQTQVPLGSRVRGVRALLGELPLLLEPLPDPCVDHRHIHPPVRQHDRGYRSGAMPRPRGPLTRSPAAPPAARAPDQAPVRVVRGQPLVGAMLTERYGRLALPGSSDAAPHPAAQTPPARQCPERRPGLDRL